MSGVHDALATVRSWLRDAYSHDTPHAALDRVEAELSRLREERDEALGKWSDSLAGERNAEAWMREAKKRAEAAEARCAELEQERDAAMDGSTQNTAAGITHLGNQVRQLEDELSQAVWRAEAAEARCARLQQALVGAQFCLHVEYKRHEASSPVDPADQMARIEAMEILGETLTEMVELIGPYYAGKVAALAGPDTPADSHSWNQPLAKLEDGKWVDPFVPADSQEFTPSRAPVDPPIVLPADSQEDWHALSPLDSQPEEPT